MKSAKETQAVDLPFDVDECYITCRVSDHTGGHLAIPGLLTAEQGKYPTEILYGDLPIEWVARAASFPQCHKFDVCTGKLSNRAYVALTNGELDCSFLGSGQVVGAFAALSLDAFDTSERRKHAAIDPQTEGLELVAGVAPISRVKMPMKVSDESVWEAIVDKDASFTWSMGGELMTFRYDYSLRTLNGSEFGMAFGPVLRLSSAQPLAIVDWWFEWVCPLHQLISLLTGTPREVRYLLVVVDSAALRSHRDQVIGWDITYLPVNSTRTAAEESWSALKLVGDDLSLLALLQAWWRQLVSRHPLFETYDAMATATDQHPRKVPASIVGAGEGVRSRERNYQV